MPFSSLMLKSNYGFDEHGFYCYRDSFIIIFSDEILILGKAWAAPENRYTTKEPQLCKARQTWFWLLEVKFPVRLFALHVFLLTEWNPRLYWQRLKMCLKLVAQAGYHRTPIESFFMLAANWKIWQKKNFNLNG